MVSMTLSIAEELKKEMDRFPEINWSEIAREAIKQRILWLRKFREFTKESTITEKDSIELGRRLKKGRFKEIKDKRII